VIDKALPYCAQPRPKLSRYHVADPYLRFWLRFIRAGIPALERGRGDVVYQQIHDSWSSFAGRAIEPLMRNAIQILLPDERFGGAEFVGSFWNRDGIVEVDLVGGGDSQGARAESFEGDDSVVRDVCALVTRGAVGSAGGSIPQRTRQAPKCRRLAGYPRCQENRTYDPRAQHTQPRGTDSPARGHRLA
jgi:hypothetical protein